MKRLIEKIVFSGLVTAWRLATCPTSRSPDLVKPTTDGVIRLPSGLVMTTGSPPSITATTEFVVPEIDTDNLAHCVCVLTDRHIRGGRSFITMTV